ncbi:MAG: tRNA (adenosine(37)-N6)-threonylcarbamoyltransferase complex dimerization subunit type 1 TsaB [Oscillospiraceae bacterium]|nr:tRNA (adenosine(37)-N6)-threonylcarbamoyltransferase complex dimerization subunit type 1 TsaB [Oscillospiraceae bacterium]
MKILAVDCSAKTAGVAVVDENAQILSESFVNAGLTHSETLLPMIDSALSFAKISVCDVDSFVITNGPGSFTGIRIGIAAVKGLAAPYNTPCYGVSTLKAMAYNLKDEDCIACCAMDARCAQVYFAAFRCGKNRVERLTEDMAIPAAKLVEFLSEYKSENIVCVGDGAHIAYEHLKDKLSNVRLADGLQRYQRAWGAACAVLNEKADFLSPSELLPVYLRLSQAERELKKKNGDLSD